MGDEAGGLLAGIVGAGAYLAIIGYLYDAPALYTVSGYSSMPLHTAVGQAVLGAGLFLARPDRGLMQVILSGRAAGAAARRLLPVALLTPIVLGYLSRLATKMGLMPSGAAELLLVIAFVAIFAGTILWSVATVDRVDAARRRLELASRIAHEQTKADKRFRSLLESAPDATIVADPEGRIMLVNAQTEQLFGYGRDEMLGKPVEMLLPERMRGVHLGHRATFHLEPRVLPMGTGGDLIGLRKDGTEFPVEVSLSPVETEDGTLVSAAIRDSSERKRHEAELAAARAEAEAASRAKSEFLSQMSHELRTPLNAVIGFAQMLEIDPQQALTDRQTEFCRSILRGGHNLLELIDDILDLARIESGRVSLSLEPILCRRRADAGARHDEAARHRGRSHARRQPCGGHPPVRADDLRLRQVLLNLISNAIKYNQKGGSIVVSALTTPKGTVRLVVADTGIGIPESRQQELFQPFSRLGAEFTAVEGTGIGLSLAKKLAEAMGGTIGFSSKVGEGSTFWVELPIEAAAGEPEAPDTAAVMATPPASAGAYSLLYVEDNPANLRLMQHLVSTLPNVQMLSASTPLLGLDLARTHRPDVIVLDLNLPEMNGFELLARLKATPETRDTPVIALTASAMPREVKRGIEAGSFRYMTKPDRREGISRRRRSRPGRQPHAAQRGLARLSVGAT